MYLYLAAMTDYAIAKLWKKLTNPST